MKPVDQNRFGSGEGNCFAAAIASITGLDLELLTAELGNGEVHGYYENGAWVSTGQEHWYDRAQRVLLSYGWELTYDPLVQPEGYAIYCGVSPRGLDHATVGLNGVIVHDPHPSRAGVLEVERYYKLEAYACRDCGAPGPVASPYFGVCANCATNAMENPER